MRFVLIRGQPRENGRHRRYGRVAWRGRGARQRRSGILSASRESGCCLLVEAVGKPLLLWGRRRSPSCGSGWETASPFLGVTGRMGRLPNTQTPKPRTPPDIWGQAPEGWTNNGTTPNAQTRKVSKNLGKTADLTGGGGMVQYAELAEDSFLPIRTLSSQSGTKNEKNKRNNTSKRSNE